MSIFISVKEINLSLPIIYADTLEIVCFSSQGLLNKRERRSSGKRGFRRINWKEGKKVA
jgi:hypothetical protein